MAIIEQQPSSGGQITGWDISEVCPAGAHVAVCLEVKDTMDVTRPRYEDPSTMEIVNLTRFLFGIKGMDGLNHRVQTHDLKISGHEKSALIGFLTSWTAKSLDQMIGWNYEEMAGQPAMVTIVHKTSQKGRVYATIASITPVVPQLLAQAPKVEEFAVPPADSQVKQDATTPAAVPQTQTINETPSVFETPAVAQTVDESKTIEEPPF